MDDKVDRWAEAVKHIQEPCALYIAKDENDGIQVEASGDKHAIAAMIAFSLVKTPEMREIIEMAVVFAKEAEELGLEDIEKKGKGPWMFMSKGGKS